MVYFDCCTIVQFASTRQFTTLHWCKVHTSNRHGGAAETVVDRMTSLVPCTIGALQTASYRRLCKPSQAQRSILCQCFVFPVPRYAFDSPK